MREILFRGRRSNNVWLTGDVRFIGNRVEICSGYCSVEIQPNTVGQFTGKLDKNKKKIFEGDIFHLEDDIFAVVVFSDGCFRLEEYGLCGTWTESGYDECGGGYGIIECEPIDWYSLFDMEVIGNIHDNPELIPH